VIAPADAEPESRRVNASNETIPVYCGGFLLALARRLRKHLVKGDAAVLGGITSFVFGAVGAAAGWLLLKFVGEPFRKFFDMKREGLESLNIYRNLELPTVSLEADDGIPESFKAHVGGAKWKRLREAQEVFRSHGSRFLAFAATEQLGVLVLKLLGFNPEQAGRGFIGLSNTISEHGPERHKNRTLIERSLKAA
jgi:hypothetical protein